MTIFKSRIGRFPLLSLIVLFCSVQGIAQSRTISGTVIDSEDGSSLPGATIMIQGGSNGTITDIDGRFTLDASSQDQLVISFIGYSSTTVTVGNQSEITVKLDVSIEALDEIVVVGYGTQQKKVATGSISRMTPQNLEGYKNSNIVSTFDGQVSGVMVSPSSGQPGSSSSILIRGISTNGDNSPLYVVDGLLLDNINNLNSSDIESIDVLKDAASTAIYGTRGANGVIIITTKKGTKGQSKISYEAFTSISQPWKVPEMLGAADYIDITREKYANGGQTNALNTLGFPQVGDPITNNTDWMNVIMDQAVVTNHRVSATFENSLLSLEYWDQNGVIGGSKSNYKRYGIRYNSTKEINKYVTIGENLYIYRTQNPKIGENNAFGTVLADAYAYDPLTPVYDENAQYGFAQSKWVQKEYINPLSRLYLSNNNGQADNVQGNVNLKIKPFAGLTLVSDFGVSMTWTNYRNFTPSYNFHPSFFNVNNSVSQGYNNYQNTQFENYASYKKDIGKHSFTVVAGTTSYARRAEAAGGSTLNIPDAELFNDNFHIIDAGRDTSDLAYGSFDVFENRISYYGRVQYDLDNKYLFTASLRRDGSSKFGSDKQFGTFPAVSAGWVISEEQFFPKVMGISFLKLRGSWGINGSDRIQNLGYAPIIKSGVFKYPLGADQVIVNGSTAASLPNPQLQWEQSIQTDIGLELKFFQDRLSTEFDVYKKTTSKLLGQQPVPGYTGVTDFPVANLGEFENKGLEATISYKQNFGKLNFKSTLNFTTFKNKVVKVPSSLDYVNGWGWPVRNTSITRMSEGQPVGHFVGLKTEGIFQNQAEVFSHISSTGDALQPNAKPGDLIFKDVNGDGKINNDDLTNIGSPWPKQMIGLNLSANYMGFDCMVLFSAQLGKDIYRTYERSDISFTNYQSFWKDRWTEENPSKILPRVVSNDPNGNQRPSDFYVEDGSFLRLRNLQLGYNVPANVLQKIKLSQLRIYASGNNLWTVTNYRGFDPEIGTTGWILDTGIDKGYYPSNKTYGLGINITM